MSTRMLRWIAVPILATGMVLCAVGCARTVPEETPAANAASAQGHAASTVEQAREAARMAVEMEREPTRAPEILEAHHMTRASYEDLLFKIARDPELSDAYDAARTS
jgi:hypothetical protein